MAAGVWTRRSGRVGRDLALIHARTADRPDIAAAFDTYAYFFALRVSPFLLFTAERHPDVAPRCGRWPTTSAAQDRAHAGDISAKNILAGPDGPCFSTRRLRLRRSGLRPGLLPHHLLLKTVWLRPDREAVMASFDALRSAYAAGLCGSRRKRSRRGRRRCRRPAARPYRRQVARPFT